MDGITKGLLAFIAMALATLCIAVVGVLWAKATAPPCCGPTCPCVRPLPPVQPLPRRTGDTGEAK